MKAKLSFVIILAGVLVVMCMQLGCNKARSNLKPDPAQTAAEGSDAPGTEYVASVTEGVVTMMVKSAEIPDYLDVPAQIEADPTLVVHVYTPAGGRITEMKVRPWDYVSKGQTLAILESSDLARAVADYHKALADNQVKQDALARAKFLFAHSAIAQKELQQAQGDAAMAEAEVQATRAQIQVFGMNPDEAAKQLRVVAPRSGVILDVRASQGEFSTGPSAAQPLCTIADLSTVWALGHLLEKDFSSVKTGEPAQLTLVAIPGRTWEGRVALISSDVDPVTRTLQLRVVLRNEGALLRPDMFGTLRLTLSRTTRIVVPNAAVVREGTTAYVFVQKSSGHFDRHEVTLGAEVGSSGVEVSSGLQTGDTVVVEGAELLRPSGTGS